MDRRFVSVMHEQGQKDDNGKWNSDQPEQCASTKAHVSLHAKVGVTTAAGGESSSAEHEYDVIMVTLRVDDRSMRPAACLPDRVMTGAEVTRRTRWHISGTFYSRRLQA